MLGMGFSDKPTKYEYTVHDHADMHESLLSELGVESAHILAHDLGDSVGQEMLARHEFGQQAYGALHIQSITWLNGGLFNETFSPRLLQKVPGDGCPAHHHVTSGVGRVRARADAGE